MKTEEVKSLQCAEISYPLESKLYEEVKPWRA